MDYRTVKTILEKAMRLAGRHEVSGCELLGT
jgi:hypothetical protein